MITGLFAGVPVSDLDAGIGWYSRFFGRPPDLRVGEEVLWDIDEHATLFIEPDAARAGAGRITFGVAGLDALLAAVAASTGAPTRAEAGQAHLDSLRNLMQPPTRSASKRVG